MKLITALILFLSSSASFASVEFKGDGWFYNSTTAATIESVGMTSNPNGMDSVVLNFSNFRQIILRDSHLQMGQTLVAFQGKCIKIIPGYKFQSANFILNCN